MKSWLLAVRFKTLTASVAPVIVAAALTLRTQGWVNEVLFFCCLMAALFAQVGANFFNDALDFKKGSDTNSRLGPERMTQKGLIGEKQMMAAGFLAFFAALLFAIPIWLQVGWIVIFVGLVSLFLAYAYTGGPFPFARHGLGEFVVVCVFGLQAVLVSYYVQTLNFSIDGLVLALQVGFMAAVIISINNLRDIEEDRLTHKRTLAVMFGKKVARYKIFMFFLFSYGLGLYWLFQSAPWAFVLPIISFPCSLALSYKIFKVEPSSQYNKFLAQSAFLHFVFSLLLGVGLLI